MQAQANKHRRDFIFQQGDTAWLRTDNLVLPGHLTRKLAAKWIGPYRIVEVVNPVAVKLDLPENLKLHPVVHISQLKPHECPEVAPERPVFENDSV